jgi:hypothetical protein
MSSKGIGLRRRMRGRRGAGSFRRQLSSNFV